MKIILRGLKQWILVLLTQKNDASPTIFFFQLSFLALFKSIESPTILLTLCFIIIIYQKINYFWYIGIILQPNLSNFAVVNLLFGLLSCNQKWKVKLFLYLLIYFLTYQTETLHELYNLVSLLGLSIQTYIRLPFIKLEDNKVYFVGFIGFMIHYGFRILFRFIGTFFDSNTFVVEILIIAISGLSAYNLIHRRISYFLNQDIQKIQTPIISYHYAVHFKNKNKNSFVSKGIYQSHKAKCNVLDCCCRVKSKIGFERLYIREIIKYILDKFKCSEFKQILEAFYIEELLQDDMLPLAIEVYSRQNDYNWDLFKNVQNFRIKRMMKNRLKFTESGYSWKNKFQDAFSYEKNLDLLQRYIIELIDLKMNFWIQILQKSSHSQKFKKIGSDFQNKLNKTNSFYQKEIKTIQEQTKVFNGYKLYGLFLSTVTNQSNFLNKNNNKLNKTPIELAKQYKLAIIKISLTGNRMGQIENLNNNYLKMIGSNCSKDSFLGKDINSLIPKCYLQEHCAGMIRLREQNQKGRIGQQLETIFIIDSNNCSVACSIFLKFSPDIFNELSIISILKHYITDQQYILLNGQNVPEYVSDKNVDIGIIRTKNITNMLEQFRQKWDTVDEEDPVYFLQEPIKLHMKYKQQEYLCTISSPLSKSFTFPKKPPIHFSMKVRNNIFRYDSCENQIKKDSYQNIEQPSNQSQLSQAKSLKQTVSKTIRIFEQKRVKVLFCKFYTVLMVMFTLITISLSVFYSTLKTQCVESNTNNLIEPLLVNYNLQSQMMQFMSNGLTLYGIQNKIIPNQASSNSHFSTDSQQIIENTKTICSSLSQALKTKDKLSTKMFRQYFQIIYQIRDFQIKQNRTSSTMINNLITYVVVDCQFLCQGGHFQKLLINEIYWQYLFPIYNQIIYVLKNSFYQQFSNNDYKIFALLFSSIPMILLFAICVFFGQRILQTQENIIFQLLASLSSHLLQNDIQHLNNLQSFIGIKNKRDFYFGNQIQNQLQQSPLSVNHKQKQGKKKIRKKGMTSHTIKNKIKSGRLIALLIVLLASFFVVLFYFHKKHTQFIRSNFQEITSRMSWKNSRFSLLVGLKTLLLGFEREHRVHNQTLRSWINQTLKNHRQNYDFQNDSELTEFPCDQQSSLCQNGTINLLKITSMYDVLSVFTFNSGTLQHLPAMDTLLRLLSETDQKLIDGLEFTFQRSKITTLTQYQIFFSIFWVFLTVSIIISYFCLQKLKKQHKHTLRLICLLTKSMVIDNKRVQSYLQRLSRLSI